MKHNAVGERPPKLGVWVWMWGKNQNLSDNFRQFLAKQQSQIIINLIAFFFIIDTNLIATLRNCSSEPRIDLSTTTFSITEK